MPVVTIPFNYRPERDSIVPICVSDTNSLGERIAEGWIIALADVANPIRGLARRVLQDVWRASELADETLDDLSRLHGDDLGKNPAARVYVQAKWMALDKRAGGRRARKGLELEPYQVLMDHLREPRDFAEEYERKQFLSVLDARLAELGFADVRRMMRLMLQGYEPHEIYEELGITRYSYTHRFWRGIRKALNGL